jgi:GTP-dependent dephospho-CoA kinase
VYRLPAEMRSLFQEPFGPVHQTEQLRSLVAPSDTLVCIGDFVSLKALEVGLKPKLIIVDYKTERAEVGELLRAILTKYGRTVLRARNPAATVTAELYLAVVQALRLAGPVRLEVEGEEDLAGLPVFAEAPDGTVVFYGMPKRGVAVVRVDDAMRAKARGLLDRMRIPPDAQPI